VTEHPKCRVRLTILDESSGKGKAAGHKVKLTAALVLAGTSTEGLSKPGRWVPAFQWRQNLLLAPCVESTWDHFCPLCGPMPCRLSAIAKRRRRR
jgi:hypothetical protein